MNVLMAWVILGALALGMALAPAGLLYWVGVIEGPVAYIGVTVVWLAAIGLALIAIQEGMK